VKSQTSHSHQSRMQLHGPPRRLQLVKKNAKHRRRAISLRRSRRAHQFVARRSGLQFIMSPLLSSTHLFQLVLVEEADQPGVVAREVVALTAPIPTRIARQLQLMPNPHLLLSPANPSLSSMQTCQSEDVMTVVLLARTLFLLKPESLSLPMATHSSRISDVSSPIPSAHVLTLVRKLQRRTMPHQMESLILLWTLLRRLTVSHAPQKPQSLFPLIRRLNAAHVQEHPLQTLKQTDVSFPTMSDDSIMQQSLRPLVR
jgi:hypothetical protein